MQSQQQKSRPQLVVYFAHCPDHGPEHRVYDEEDIHGAGGIHAIEAEMQRETYWFARLGVIEGELSTSGSTYTYKDEAIAGSCGCMADGASKSIVWARRARASDF